MSEMTLEQFIAHLPKTHKVRLEYLLLKTEADTTKNLKAEVVRLREALTRLHRNGQKQGWVDNYSTDMKIADEALNHKEG